MSVLDKDSSVFDNFELRLNDFTKKYLREIAKWAFLLSIIGFIGIALMVFLGIVMWFVVKDTSVYASIFPLEVLSLSYLFIGVVNFFPVLYLFRFSRKMKSALATKNGDDLTQAFANLKSHYKYIGILMIIVLALYVLSILGGVISGLSYL